MSERLVYWDSDLFISRIQRTAGRIEVLEELTRLAECEKLKLATSAYTLVEVAKFDELDLPSDEEEKLIVDFFENPFIAVLPIDDATARIARQVIRDHRMKPKDAIHLATALRHKVPVLHAYDDHFLRIAHDVDGICIEEPTCDQLNLGLSTSSSDKE